MTLHLLVAVDVVVVVVIVIATFVEQRKRASRFAHEHLCLRAKCDLAHENFCSHSAKAGFGRRAAAALRPKATVGSD